ncbi:MAG: hypothetical protein ACI96P_002030, partial [Candidatus Azotimanducaceae bacterium]
MRIKGYIDMKTLKRLTPALLALACTGWLLSACSSTQVIKSNSTPA